jgi:myo-inositol 2-dehydrogenase / D-chiro-inositol 1-dehydrogenase
VTRVGVVGTGVMGAGHVRTLASEVTGASVAAVADVDAERARQVAETAAPGAEVFGDPLALIASDGVEAVLVVSSDPTHEALVLACLQAGKPVLCEKPLAPTSEASLRIVEAEAALGRRLVQVAFMRRFDAGYRALKARSEELGATLLIHNVHRNPSVPPFFTSEMIITSSVTHEIDVARWLTGEEIVSASVRTGRLTTNGGGMLDPQLVTLETAGGVLVDVEAFVNAGYGYEIRCELVGEHGTADLPRSVAPGFLERFHDAYRTELQAWADAIAAGPPTGPSAWDGYAASVVADACLASLAAGGGQAGVELAPLPALYAAAVS